MSASGDDTEPGADFDVSGTTDAVYQVNRVERMDVISRHYHGVKAGDEDREPLVPRELPAPNRRFHNRTEELALLRELLDGNDDAFASRLVLVDGADGVGKTDLVALWGSQFAERFPDGTIYCDLSTYTIADAVDVVEVLGSLLNSLNVPRKHLFGTADGRARQWRSASHGLNLMVVLDNIEDPALLRYLVPTSPSITVVLISRVNAAAFVAEGADRVPVEPFDSEHSRKLLSRICGPHRLRTEPEAVDGLLNLCDGRPGTVALLGGCIATVTGLSLSELLREIASRSPARSHEITAAITRRMAVESLSAGARGLHRLLSAHPGEDLPHELVEALSPTDSAPLLEELRSVELVTAQPSERWRVPGGDPADAAAFRTILDWYLAMARRADVAATAPRRLRLSDVDESRAADPGWSGAKDALDWLEREVRDLVAIQKAAQAHGWDEAVVALEESLWVLYLKRSFPGFQEATSRLAVEAAVRLPGRRFESRMRAQRGRCLWQRGAVAEALSESLHARELAVGDDELEASAAEMTSRVHLAMRRYDEAVAVLSEAVPIYERLGDTRGLALVRQFLGQAYLGLDEEDRAGSLLRQALDGFGRVGAEPDMGRVLLDIARLHNRSGGHEAALSALEESIGHLSRAGMLQRLSAAHELHGDILSETGRTAAAREAWGNALRTQVEQHNGDGPEASQLRAKLAAL